MPRGQISTTQGSLRPHGPPFKCAFTPETRPRTSIPSAGLLTALFRLDRTCASRHGSKPAPSLAFYDPMLAKIIVTARPGRRAIAKCGGRWRRNRPRADSRTISTICGRFWRRAAYRRGTYDTRFAVDFIVSFRTNIAVLEGGAMTTVAPKFTGSTWILGMLSMPPSARWIDIVMRLGIDCRQHATATALS